MSVKMSLKSLSFGLEICENLSGKPGNVMEIRYWIWPDTLSNRYKFINPRLAKEKSI